MGTTLTLSELESFDSHASRRGNERRFLCPLCGAEKPRDASHRSLAVNSSTGEWKCHRCDSSGKLKEFWEDGEDFTSKRHRQQASLERKFSARPQPQKDKDEIPDWIPEIYAKMRTAFGDGMNPAAAYLHGRGIPYHIARKAGCGFAKEWKAGGGAARRVVFPVWDGGRLVAIQGRLIDEDEKGGIKAITRGPKSQGLFLSQPDALALPLVVVCEGPIDALSLAACGVPAVATCGKSWPSGLPKALAFRRVGIGYDSDGPGEEAAAKLTTALESFGAFVVRVCPPSGKDWNEYLCAVGSEMMRQALASIIASGEQLWLPPAASLLEPEPEPEAIPDPPDWTPPAPLRVMESDWVPNETCRNCGSPLTWTREDECCVETIPADDLWTDFEGRVCCGFCNWPQPGK